MWMQPRDIAQIQINYLAAFGRAMALAQNFEMNCRYTLGMFDLGKKIDDDSNLTALQAIGQKLMNRSLGRAIKKNRESDELFGNCVVTTLEVARVARNYFSHQGAEPALYIAPMNGKHTLKDMLSKDVDLAKIEQERMELVVAHVQKRLPQFEKYICDLAAGDSIVSEWSYIIQEKDVCMPLMAKSYSEDVAAWVLAPLRSKPICEQNC